MDRHLPDDGCIAKFHDIVLWTCITWKLQCRWRKHIDRLTPVALDTKSIEKISVKLATSVFYESTRDALKFHSAHEGKTAWSGTANFMTLVVTKVWNVMNVKTNCKGKHKRIYILSVTYWQIIYEWRITDHHFSNLSRSMLYACSMMHAAEMQVNGLRKAVIVLSVLPARILQGLWSVVCDRVTMDWLNNVLIVKRRSNLQFVRLGLVGLTLTWVRRQTLLRQRPECSPAAVGSSIFIFSGLYTRFPWWQHRIICESEWVGGWVGGWLVSADPIVTGFHQHVVYVYALPLLSGCNIGDIKTRKYYYIALLVQPE